MDKRKLPSCWIIFLSLLTPDWNFSFQFYRLAISSIVMKHLALFGLSLSLCFCLVCSPGHILFWWRRNISYSVSTVSSTSITCSQLQKTILCDDGVYVQMVKNIRLLAKGHHIFGSKDSERKATLGPKDKGQGWVASYEARRSAVLTL